MPVQRVQQPGSDLQEGDGRREAGVGQDHRQRLALVHPEVHLTHRKAPHREGTDERSIPRQEPEQAQGCGARAHDGGGAARGGATRRNATVCRHLRQTGGIRGGGCREAGARSARESHAEGEHNPDADAGARRAWTASRRRRTRRRVRHSRRPRGRSGLARGERKGGRSARSRRLGAATPPGSPRGRRGRFCCGRSRSPPSGSHAEGIEDCKRVVCASCEPARRRRI